MSVYFIISLIVGIILGCGFAFMVVGIILKSSNKMGDSKGDFTNFAGTSMHFISKRNL
ncbi:MAG: hypothetical protein IJZ42_10980 [Lachnospiraceae bacterium]|nr:hypothetical protein [Lachnospiraceae bacterium]